MKLDFSYRVSLKSGKAQYFDEAEDALNCYYENLNALQENYTVCNEQISVYEQWPIYTRKVVAVRINGSETEQLNLQTVIDGVCTPFIF